ncbi:MAG TPA: CDP-diacylglycerol--glycerol-3-phosphate 3-phosphatidyltransferase [Oscillospiraceae bacterium]|nr:CDP-diacylglycerol--glycerol-3-phosphate 3-phosphatidyltransferase [Oscillospiraceae bacterium]HPF54987.1 CDP-diacylglycerol--glycerol-3-phosphate 3-phosphatidyltransferase [Clostridiales bacterium]HPK34400.1 CDP-diacylglycerol--glycerol-3-phosphate 3-phosphatidyltransferase [Oscillospiraceae bacterium]HPR76515.1 CDP-diacylglycerol--glycerol-3-phosphate 3-phosphatidyltransferase [Oscillospiraceae bacterium]
METKKEKMNLPNKLTMFRIFCVPFFLFFLLINDIPLNILWAGIIFAIAMVTDLLDGRIARKYNLITAFGKFWDPLADKLMTLTALIGIAALDGSAILPTVVACVVLWRELIVTGLRLVAAGGSGKVIGANIWGKLKTTFQCIYIGFELFAMFFTDNLRLPEKSAFYADTFQPIFNIVIMVTGIIMIVLTIWSGWTYYRDNREALKI